MPKYRPERERIKHVWGAGLTAKRGLSKPKPTAEDRQWAGYDESLEQPKPTWEMDRGEFLRHMENSRKKKKEQKELEKWKAKVEKKQVKVIEPGEFTARITPQVLEELDAILGKPAPSEENLSENGLEPSRRIRKLNDYSFIFYYVSEADGFAGGFHAALELLEKRKPLRALEILNALSASYLADEENQICPLLGEMALRYTRIITRTWVVAHASEYAGHDLEKFKMFHGGYLTRTMWSAAGVLALERAGTLMDLPSLTMLGRDCWESSMEGYCRETASHIRIRESLRFALRGMSKDERKDFGLETTLSDGQLVSRLGWLFYKLGIGEFLEKHPSMAQFGRGFMNPYAMEGKAGVLVGLVKGGLNQTLNFDGMRNSGVDGKSIAEMRAAGHFLENAGIIESKVKLLKGEGGQENQSCRGEYLLTDMGKDLVERLMKEIKEMKVGYEGKFEDPMQTLLRDVFG